MKALILLLVLYASSTFAEAQKPRYEMPAMLLIHGDSDRLIPMANVEELHDKLRAVGVETQLIVIAGADHGPHFPGTDQDLAEIYAHAVEWMDTHLKISD